MTILVLGLFSLGYTCNSTRVKQTQNSTTWIRKNTHRLADQFVICVFGVLGAGTGYVCLTRDPSWIILDHIPEIPAESFMTISQDICSLSPARSGQTRASQCVPGPVGFRALVMPPQRFLTANQLCQREPTHTVPDSKGLAVWRHRRSVPLKGVSCVTSHAVSAEEPTCNTRTYESNKKSGLVH